MRELHRQKTRPAGIEVRRGFEDAMRAAGATVVSNEDDQHCETVLSEGRRDALIVNRVLPDGSTWTAVAAFRQDQSAIRVRFVTGNRSEGSVLEILVPCPPIRLEEMRPTILNLVVQAPRRLARRLAFAGILVDRLIQSAWCQGQAIRLTPSEYRQFEEFMIASEASEVAVT